MTRFLSLIVAGSLAVGGAGCGTKSPEGGTPGTEEAFTFSGPSLPTKVKQAGDPAEVSLKVKPDEKFAETIVFSASAVDGLAFEFQPPEVKPADAKSVKLMVTAAEKAPLGEKTVSITATPSKGTAVSIDVKLLVEVQEPK